MKATRGNEEKVVTMLSMETGTNHKKEWIKVLEGFVIVSIPRDQMVFIKFNHVVWHFLENNKKYRSNKVVNQVFMAICVDQFVSLNKMFTQDFQYNCMYVYCVCICVFNRKDKQSLFFCIMLNLSVHR